MSGNGKQGVSWTSSISSVMLERKPSKPGNEVRPGAQEGSQRNSRRAVENRSAAGKDCRSPNPGHGSRGQRGLLLRQRSSPEPLEWEHWLQDPRLPGLTLLLLLSRFSRVQLCVTQWQQSIRLRCPWDSPGKNSGVGCHFLLQCMKVKSESEVAQSCPTLSDPMDCSPAGSSVHGIFQASVLEWGHSRQEYWNGVKQWEIAQRKPLEYKTQHHPTTSSTLCRTSHLNNKQNKIQTQSSADRITTSLNLAHRKKNKQNNNNKKKNSA